MVKYSLILVLFGKRK